MRIQLPNMCYQLIVLFLQISVMDAAPLLLVPSPWMAQSMQQVVLQKQLMELQALQLLHARPPLQMNDQSQPLVLMLPQDQPSKNVNIHQHFELTKNNENKPATHTKNEIEDDDLNSVIIDAESDATENQNQGVQTQPQRAIVLLPNGRLSLGDLISAIPWLPIEVNVPDTITWAYNGIASGIGSIIAIIGTPFQSTQTQTSEVSLKSLLNQIQTTKRNAMRPMILMPIDGPMLPIQV